MNTMLDLSGEGGYRSVSVEKLLERSGTADLRHHFESLDECFATAYETEAERLYAILVGAGAADSSWRECLRAGVTALFDYVIEQPRTARALLSEVCVAGGPAFAKHEEILERLSRALDKSARRETCASRHSPPPITAEFMVGAIEQSVRAFLFAEDPQAIWASLPELMHLVVGPYLGEQAAAEELARPAPSPRD